MITAFSISQSTDEKVPILMFIAIYEGKSNETTSKNAKLSHVNDD